MNDSGGSRAQARRSLGEAGVVVLDEDNHVLVVSKPAGLLSQGGPKGEVSLPDLIDAYRRDAEGKPGRAYVGLVHRLDRNVSGVMVLAKTSKAASRLSAMFRDRRDLEKTYLAWVAGLPSPRTGVLESRLVRDALKTSSATSADDDAKEARLRYEVEGVGPKASRVRIVLETGRTHQIRAQMAEAGHPLIGDAKYGGQQGARPALHAWRLAFVHPVSREHIVVEAPLPEDLRRLDRALGIEPHGS